MSTAVATPEPTELTLKSSVHPASAYGIPGVTPRSPDALYIVSIFPFERRHELQLGKFRETEDGEVPMAGFRTFHIGPAPRSRYRILRVEGGLKWIMNYAHVGPEQEAPTIEPIWQPAEIVAHSLVTDWTKHTLGTVGSPGIAILPPEQMKRNEKGEILADKEDQPIPEHTFLEALRSVQTTFAQGCVNRANDLNTQGKATEITELDRVMAKWLYGSGASKMPWFPKQEFRSLKECPKCRKEVIMDALGCENCGVDFPDYYVKYHLDPVADPVVAAAITRMNEAASSQVAGNPHAALPSEIAAIEKKPQNTWTRAERDQVRDHRSRKN